MTKLEKLLAEHERNAKRFVELRGKETLTEEELTEKRSIVDREKSLKAEIQEERDDIALEETYNASTNGGAPEAGDPQERSSIEVVDKPIYRNFSEQIEDVILIGKAKEIPGVDTREAVKRIVEHENRAAGTGQIVGSGIDGGLAVQTDFSTDIIDHGFNNGVMLSKTAQREITTNANGMTFLGIDESSRVNGSRGGGVTVYTKAELAQYTSSKSKIAEVELKLNKLTGLLFVSDEMLEDAGAMAGEIADLFPKEFDFKIQDLLFRGSGSGEPLGIMNANAKIAVAKDSGQTATTITRTNLSNMKARLGGRGMGQWYANQDTIAQLDGLTDATTRNKIFTQTSTKSGMLDGIPIDFVEQCETLGTAGDIVLVDFSEYITIRKGGLKQAESIHLKFDYGQKTIKWTYRMDGQCRWKSALTPFKGSNTTSPIVTLATRS